MIVQRGMKMNREINTPHEIATKDGLNDLRFFTETIKVGRISPLAFLEVGNEYYKNQHFYWQNAKQTLTLVGVGHAEVLTSEGNDERFSDISARWKTLQSAIIKEDKDKAPVLFGGFSFDPKSVKDSEWDEFPSAYFFVPSFQLTNEDGETYISINLINKNGDGINEFEKLREERDRLIHVAEVNEFEPAVKPTVESIVEIEKERYVEAVKEVTQKIKHGDADKVVIARSVIMNFKEKVASVAALHHITNEQQESYHFGLQRENQLFFGATPERLIEISKGRAYSACIAGSIERGTSAKEDRELGKELLNDDKNLAEHNYVVKMISTVFHKYCTDIDMPSEPSLMKIRDIQHLFTSIEGDLEQETDIFSLIAELHPTPALGGVPTNKSMEIIREKEQMDRGYYAGPIGWTDSEGNGEFAVAIRSALLDGNKAYLYAGGGIVADSEAEQEYEETWVKFRPVLRALGGKLNG